MIEQISKINGYSMEDVMRTCNCSKKQNSDKNKERTTEKKQWADFPFFGEDICILTKVVTLGYREVKIQWERLPAVKRHHKVKYGNSGVYRLKCYSCERMCSI
jgi:hypothetical protein